MGPQRGEEPDPAPGKLAGLPGEQPEERDRRLRTWGARLAEDDILARYVLSAVAHADDQSTGDPAVTEIDSWWALQDYLASDRASPTELAGQLARLESDAQAWGDVDGASGYRHLRRLIGTIGGVGIDAAFAARADERLARVPPALRLLVQRADEAAYEYLTDRRPECLTAAGAAWHAVLSSDPRLSAAPELQLSLFCDAGVVLRECADTSPDPVALDRSIRCWQAALQWFKKDGVVPTIALLNLAPRLERTAAHLGAALLRRAHENDAPGDAEAAVKQLRGALLLTPQSAPALPRRVAALGSALVSLSNEARVVDGVDLLSFAAMLDADRARRAALVAQFAAACWARWERFRSQSSLDAVLSAREVLRRSPGDVAALLPSDVRRGFAQLDTETQEEPAHVIHTLTREARTPEGDDAIAELNALAAGLLTEYLAAEDLALLDRAAEALDVVLARAPAGSPAWRQAAANVATCLTERYQRRGTPADLQRVIEVQEAALRADESDPPFLERLAGALMLRHRRTASADDLERAIRLAERACDRTSAGPASLAATCRVTLAIALLDRWHLTSDVADLDRALEAVGQAMALAPSPSRIPALRADRAALLSARYEALGDPHDLEESIALCIELLDAFPPGSRESASVRHRLGVNLRAEYARTGDARALEDAIVVFRAASDASRGGPEWPARLSDLGTAIGDRYDATGDLHDLDTRIEIHEQALTAPPLAADRPLILAHLSGALRERARRTRRVADVNAAVARARAAVAACAPGDRVLPECLSTLGTALFERHRWTSSPLEAAGPSVDPAQPTDLSDAIAAYERAIGATGGPSAILLNNLGLALLAEFQREEDAASLERAIERFREAIALPSAPRTQLPNVWLNLGLALKARASSSGDAADRREASQAYRTSITLGRATSVEGVLLAAQSWGAWALARGDYGEAAEAYGHAVETVQELFRAQPTRAQKETWLREAQGSSLRLAYARARAGDDLARAVEAFEWGRALLLSESLEVGGADLERLGTEHADVKARFEQAAARWMQLSTNPPMAGEGLRGATVADTLRAARDELDAAIDAVRTVEGFARFLRPPDIDDIVSAAADGPIAYVGATTREGFALIVRQDASSPSVVWLPALTDADVHEQVTRFARAYAAYRASAEPTDADRQAWCDAIDAVARWAWDAVMGALLEALGGVTRATLIPAGHLAFVPLHAAWAPATPRDAASPDVTEASAAVRRYALDAVTWAYAPNAITLAAARRATARARGDRLLAVDRPTTSRAELDLPFSTVEVDAATAVFPDHEIRAGDAASLDAVPRAWRAATVVHLSCHGWADLGRPLDSALLLAGEQPLRLRTILGERLPARLVVLSSCESGMPGTELPDEVVSLPAGLLQAGAAAAVGSLWSVPGRATAMLMFRFYELWRTGDCASPADALRHAQRWLRDTTNEQKAAYFHERLPGSGHPMSTPGARTLWRELFQRTPGVADEASLYHWAAFTYMGA